MSSMRTLLPVVMTVAVASVLFGGIGVYHARSWLVVKDREFRLDSHGYWISQYAQVLQKDVCSGTMVRNLSCSTENSTLALIPTHAHSPVITHVYSKIYKMY